MNNKALALTFAIALSLAPSLAQAVPVQGMYLENPALCDFHPPTLFSHELGDAAVFPLNEGFLVNIASTTQTCCVPDDGFPNDFEVTITNISGFRWVDLFFVVDTNVGIGNVDGLIQDITVPGYAEAFKIDNVGVNNNLISGDTNNNLVFDLLEAWTFRVTNFVAPANLAPFPSFLSPGGFAASSTNNGSNASIVANQFIPEPSCCVLCAAGLLGFAGRRRK